MAAKKKASKKKVRAKLKAKGSVGLLNSNQRKQLEAIGDIKKPKKR